MRALIVGAGAIGQYFAVRLALAGHQAILFARPHQAEAIAKGGVTLQTDGKASSVCFPTASQASEATLVEPFELVIVAVKAFATADAVSTVQAISGCQDATILTVQNGLGNEELLAKAFGEDRIVAGALTVAVDRIDATTIAASHRGGLRVAPVGRSPHNWLLALFSGAGLTVSAADDWRALKWSKLCINILGNGVCAALDWTPEHVYADRAAFTIERRCLLETIAVMERLRLKPVNLVGFAVRRLVWAARSLPTGLLRQVLRGRVAAGRSGKLPSLLVDLRAGRKQTEVSALNGAVAIEALKCGLQAPANEKISEVVSAIASGSTPWSEYRGHPDRLTPTVPS
jgi:2-dehydropantoate 2-reductase